MTSIETLNCERKDHLYDIIVAENRANKGFRNTKNTFMCLILAIVIVGLSFYAVKSYEPINTKALKKDTSELHINW